MQRHDISGSLRVDFIPSLLEFHEFESFLPSSKPGFVRKEIICACLCVFREACKLNIYLENHLKVPNLIFFVFYFFPLTCSNLDRHRAEVSRTVKRLGNQDSRGTHSVTGD
jgi:hypothetical protein